MLVLILITIAAVVISEVVLKSYLPYYSGEVKLKGLKNEVRIFRDSLAIPYIVAEDEEDAAFALGFVHAQERMFQMDLYRRAALGRLSEVIGNKVLKIDKMFRTLGIAKAVEKNFQQMDDRSKNLLIAYSKGVNAYLGSTEWHSVEFDLLGYKPTEWKPEHSIAVAKLLAWELNMGWWTKIIKAHLLEKFPANYVEEIFPKDNPNYPTTLTVKNKTNFQTPFNFLKANSEAKMLLGFSGSHVGSNNWAVDGRLSVNGKPMIANDTHLAFSLPDEWFVAVVKEKDLTVAGFTLPGVPGVLIGENGKIAWTETNLMSDEALFYSEKLNGRGTKYFKNGRWKKLKIVKDTIAVKDSANAVVNICSTDNGVLISDVHPYAMLFPDSAQSKTFVSMNWPALNSAKEFLSISRVNHSQNWEEFKEALRSYSYPGQNFVYADSKGNIGYVCGVKLIKRKRGAEDLLNGTTASGQIRFVPYDEMPKEFNPPKGFIATANNKVAKDFKYHVADLWEPPARIERIFQFLKSKKKFSLGDFKQMQSDVYSDYPKELINKLLIAFSAAKIEDKNLNVALKLLKNWDYGFSKHSQPAAIYSVFFQKLIENTFKDEMGKNLFKEFVFVADVPLRAVKKLLKNKYSFWWDNKSTPTQETMNNILRRSLTDALTFLEGKFGKDISQWQWGRLHKLTLKHPFHGHSKIIDRLMDVGTFEVGGCGTTLFNTEFSFVKPYDVTLGQAMRFIYDFSQPDVFYFTLPSGESGHVWSPHYGETTRDWLKGKYYKVNTNLDGLKNFQELTLIPK